MVKRKKSYFKEVEKYLMCSGGVSKAARRAHQPPPQEGRGRQAERQEQPRQVSLNRETVSQNKLKQWVGSSVKLTC